MQRVGLPLQRAIEDGTRKSDPLFDALRLLDTLSEYDNTPEYLMTEICREFGYTSAGAETVLTQWEGMR